MTEEKTITPRIAAVLSILVGGPMLCFFIIDFMRGASTYITPFLLVAYTLAALISSFLLALALFKYHGSQRPRIGRTILLTSIALGGFFFLAGGAQVLAESLAAWNWERAGMPRGDHGSYREFYPGDSGMAYWETPWYIIPWYAFFAAIIWWPLITTVLLGLWELERMICRPLHRKAPTTNDEPVAPEK